jgi:hypothetical protein
MALWVIAAVCSLLILSGSRDNGSIAQAGEYVGPFAGEYAGYTQTEKGALQLDYTAIHQRKIDSGGNTTGLTAAQIYDPETGSVTSTICTSAGTATLLDDNVLEITGTQKCGHSEYTLEIRALCVGVGLTSNGYTELYCADTTEEFPGFEAINLTILKRK